MSDKTERKSLSHIALGTAFAASMTFAGAAAADGNPFQVEELSSPSGYTQLAGEGNCGEGSCGDKKDEDKKDGEGNCGEGSCGSLKG